MSYPLNIRCHGVKILTTCLLSLLSGCTLYKDLRYHYDVPCKNHANVQFIFEDYVSRRFHSQSPVRVAVIPFSTQANISYTDFQFQGLGNKLAWEVHANLMASGRIPVIEVFNRQDWPGKMEEFFTGNFGAISFARQAGYDMVLVGYVEPIRQLGQMEAHAKLIEVESGVTVWYGRSSFTESYSDFQRAGHSWWFGKRRPDKIMGTRIAEDLAVCIARNLLSEEPTP